jgi:hypothetical protein
MIDIQKEFIGAGIAIPLAGLLPYTGIQKYRQANRFAGFIPAKTATIESVRVCSSGDFET